MNTKIQQLASSFNSSLARKILTSNDITPEVRDQVYHLAKVHRRLESSIVNCSFVIYARNGDPKKVEELIKRAVEVDGVKPHADFQCTLAYAHAVKGDIPESLKILNSISDSSVSIFTFLPLISTLGDHPDGLEWCLRVFDMLKRSTPGPLLCGPYGTLINKARKTEDLKKMEELFEEMEKNHVVVDKDTYFHMIHAHVKNFNIDKAVKLLEESKRRGIPHNRSYNTILDGYFTMRDFEGAARWKEKMDKDGHKPDSVTTNVQVQSLINQGRISDAIKLVADAERKGDQLDVVTFNTLIGGFAKSNNMDAALKMKDLMVNKGVQANATTYNSIIDGYCKRGDMDQAKEVVVEMERKGVNPDSFTFSTLVNGYCKKGDMEQAQHTLDMMEKQDIIPNVVTFNVLIGGYCQKGHMEQAQNTLDIMEKQDIIPDVVTFTTLITGYCKQGKMDKALEMKEEMTRRGIQPNVVTFTSLITGFCNQEKIDKALEMKEEMTRRGIQPNEVTLKVLRHLGKTNSIVAQTV